MSIFIKNTIIGYHKNDMGSFTGERFFMDKARLQDDEYLLVISGSEAKPHYSYYLHGLYSVRIDHNREAKSSVRFDLEAKNAWYTLAPIAVPEQPILLNAVDELEPAYRRQKYTGGGKGPQPLPEDLEPLFDRLLGDCLITTADTITQDMLELLSRPDETTRQQLINARLGQGGFRRDVLALWGNKCAVTGVKLPDMLNASHIKPWKESNDAERLMPTNGICLAAHLDRAFDRYLISFDEKGRILVSNKQRAELKSLGITSSLELDFLPLNLTQQHQVESFLINHRKRFNELNN